MKKLIFLLIVILLLVHFGFTDNNYVVEEQKEYMGGVKALGDLTGTFIWSSIYLLIYAASIGVPLSYLKYDVALDIETIRWMLLTWLGGMIINAFAYKLIHIHIQSSIGVALVAMPFIFALSFLINWKNDMAIGDSLKVAAVTAILCSPYFGPTWKL